VPSVKTCIFWTLQEKKELPDCHEYSLEFHKTSKMKMHQIVFDRKKGKGATIKGAIRLNYGKTLTRDDVTSSCDHKLLESAPQLGFIFTTTPMESR
jgi:hypothetical protein